MRRHRIKKGKGARDWEITGPTSFALGGNYYYGNGIRSGNNIRRGNGIRDFEATGQSSYVSGGYFGKGLYPLGYRGGDLLPPNYIYKLGKKGVGLNNDKMHILFPDYPGSKIRN